MLRWKASLKPTAAASSYTLEETFADDSANEYGWSKAASTTYVGTLVAPASSYTATRLEFHLKKTGAGGNTITAEIWSATGSAGSETPDALLATSTTTVAASGVSATKGFVAFDFSGQAIASGTKYFFVMKTPTPGDTSNYYNLTLGSSYNTTNFQTEKADATPTWSEANGGRGGYCRSYSGGGGGGSTFPSTSLVGFYKLDEASGVDAADSSGNGYHFSDNGTVASTTGTIGGETVNVRTLDRAAGKYFSLTNNANFDVGDGEDFTISFWASVSSSSGQGGIFSKRNSITASDAGYTMVLRKFGTATQIRYNAVCDGTTTVGDSQTDSGIDLGSWGHYMLVFTADATLITYVNNVQVNSDDVSSVTGSLANSYDNYIGQFAYNINGDIIADVTHLGFWKKALDSSERTALYNSGKVLAPAAATGITLETSATTTGINYSGATTINVNIPAVSANDILILYSATYDAADATSSPPSGWTKIREQDCSSIYGSTVAVYWKRASGSATATTETWTSFYSANEAYYVWVGAYSGCVTSTSPIDVDAGGTSGYASSVATSFTTTVDNAMVVSMIGVHDSATTWSPDGEIVDVEFNSGLNAHASISESIESSAGSKTVTGTFGGHGRCTIVSVALKPA